MERQDYYVYCLMRAETGQPFYVGKGRHTRMEHHNKRRENKINCQRQNIINKTIDAGLAIGAEKLAIGLSEEAAFALERFYIAAIGRHPHGPLVNRTDGGDGVSGYKASPETIARIIASKKGNPSGRKGVAMTEEQKEKLRQVHLGKKHTVEHKAKIKAGLLAAGRTMSENNKEKLKTANKNKVYTPELRKKLGDARRGKPGTLLGKKFSEEHKEKLRQAKLGVKQSSEHVAKRVEKLKGKTPWNRGVAYTEVQRAAMSRQFTEEQKTNISVAATEAWRKRRETEVTH